MKWPALLIFCCACTGGSMMTAQKFDSIHVGMSERQLVETAGSPAKIEKGKDGDEYEYVERITMGPRVVEERRYVFIVKDGKVKEKKLKDRTEPAYWRDSYDMQTSQSADESF